MSLRQFHCSPEWYGEEGFNDGAQLVEELTARAAAETYVELNLANLEYPKETTIRVRDERGVFRVFDVRVESVPECTATEKQ